MLETDWHRLEEYSAPLSAYKRMTELCRTLERERDEWRKKAVGLHKMEVAIHYALMHLETNYDIDGNSMKDSDAARKLRSAISLENSVLCQSHEISTQPKSE